MEFVKPFRPKSVFLTKEGCYIIELQNVDDDPACSIARARVEPGVKTKLHSLRGTVERYVILEGVGEVEIGETPPAPVAPFDVVYIPAGVSQCISDVGPRDLIFLCIYTPWFFPKNYEEL